MFGTDPSPAAGNTRLSLNFYGLGEAHAMPRILFSLVFLLLFGFESVAEPEQLEPSRQQLQTQISILLDHIKKIEAENAQLRQKNILDDPALRSAYLDSIKKQYYFADRVVDINVQAFDAQWWASYTILFLVVIVVLSGVSFAGFQLWKSVSVSGVQATTELEMSVSKVRITSSVVGLAVLTISLVFLYLYTVKVYEIKLLDYDVSSPTKPKAE
jgi:hypothetical protein